MSIQKNEIMEAIGILNKYAEKGVISENTINEINKIKDNLFIDFGNEYNYRGNTYDNNFITALKEYNTENMLDSMNDFLFPSKSKKSHTLHRSNGGVIKTEEEILDPIPDKKSLSNFESLTNDDLIKTKLSILSLKNLLTNTIDNVFGDMDSLDRKHRELVDVVAHIHSALDNALESLRLQMENTAALENRIKDMDDYIDELETKLENTDVLYKRMEELENRLHAMENFINNGFKLIDNRFDKVIDIIEKM